MIVLSCSDKLVRAFINSITKDDLCNTEVESECSEHSDIMASEKSVNEGPTKNSSHVSVDEEFYSQENTYKYLEAIFFKKKFREYSRSILV